MINDRMIGRHKYDLETPALLLDIEAAERNIRKMADFFADKPCQVRPHVKTHKSLLIARKQMAAGAIGVTCAKLEEARAFLEAGIGEVLIANEIVGGEKIAKLVELSRRGGLIICVDDLENAAKCRRPPVQWAPRFRF